MTKLEKVKLAIYESFESGEIDEIQKDILLDKAKEDYDENSLTLGDVTEAVENGVITKSEGFSLIRDAIENED